MATFTLYFDNPFWVAVLEIPDAGLVRATRHVFGSEPTDAELYQFLLRFGGTLLSRAEANPPAPATDRPRRKPRLAVTGLGTAAQQAVKKELEQRKQESSLRSRTQREEHDAHRRQVRQAKARARRRGH
ncbi:hypothetical protein ACWT_2168 [Actinoplanes sp. SE50]|uniref:YjdF family protein n=1 Tax=unclassified Actinoplanes TaxID=2626549 RepID=UPI00023ECAE1|nr:MULTISPECIES: YjdF family protein [unclassified Actinoplanes]AEV83188.1 yjdF-like uncharacterized protein [Actinoplanes sp. SE50/110]ATO81583.1 hypothetical protein ACWT_2168 [Actinoplanes sp. SE50]SLL98991.1 hypothetical protein ACSP50_2219 [Actinoplanes sp. SE50/110]